uniref:ORM1-like protein 3 isoform X2 n=1 Tax=Ictidomys tridecemlineatus TaxID=43179 RepID=UPI001A9FC2DD|nr:ORM1-like protein 3 isoform X2 [Ictidomys tridecemlineatus]
MRKRRRKTFGGAALEWLEREREREPEKNYDSQEAPGGRRAAVTSRGPARGADSAGAASGVLPPLFVTAAEAAAAPVPGHPSRALDLPLRTSSSGEGCQDECGHSTQRSEPQYAGDEQPWHLALLCARHWASSCCAAEHPLRECPCRLDPHQPHPQHGTS